MKNFFTNLSKASTANTLALLWTLGTFVIMILTLSGDVKCDDTTRTQIVSGILATDGIILAAYFSKEMAQKNKTE